MIDYALLDKSVGYYTSHGFSRIEVPWMVTEYVDSITRPENVLPYRVEAKKKNFIASGEQGFLYLYLKEYLPKGKFQTITPCMRNETFDYTHTKYFMKNELIITDNVTEESLKQLIQTAENFFRGIFVQARGSIAVIRDGSGYDIVYNDGNGGEIELGSYGIRECNFLRWIYGTGCAEPRTSKILEGGLS